MYIEVIVLKSPSARRLDLLQQNLWDFEVRFLEADQLCEAQVGLDGDNLLLGGLPGQNPVVYSFEKELSKWRGSKGKTPLVKALGANKGDRLIDATFGFGKDSCQLLGHGLSVHAYERVPELYFLARSCQLWQEIPEERLKIHFGSVRENPKDCPIYFDPMYEDGALRKAKSGKGMQVFHKLVGLDEDASQEAQRLRDLTSRLVVKRAPKAPMLLEKRNSTWESKAVRFDLYL